MKKNIHVRVQFLKRVESIVAKGEVAHDEQFSPFATRFSKVISAAEASERVYMFERV